MSIDLYMHHHKTCSIFYACLSIFKVSHFFNISQYIVEVPSSVAAAYPVSFVDCGCEIWPDFRGLLTAYESWPYRQNKNNSQKPLKWHLKSLQTRNYNKLSLWSITRWFLGLGEVLHSTVKPLFNKPLCNKALSITNDILQHGQSYSKTIQKPKHIIYPNITKTCQHVTKDKYETDQQGWKSFNLVLNNRTTSQTWTLLTHLQIHFIFLVS